MTTKNPGERPFRHADDRQPALRMMSMPADLNPAGDVFGGWIMSMVDIAGGIAARRRTRSRVVTVAVNSFVFKQPVSLGDLVSFYAEVVAVGRTSLTVDVEVFIERDPEHPVELKVTEAKLTYVALDEAGNKRLIPPDWDK
jgi:acyl-CoA thioesterase YciA